MGLIKHVNILTALEMRALWYHNKGHAKADQDKILYNEAMDETGTSKTSSAISIISFISNIFAVKIF